MPIARIAADRVAQLKQHRNPWMRRAAGVVLIAGGLPGCLPVLDFWMLPLGVIVPSDDIPWLRRQRRRLGVWWQRRRAPRRPPATERSAK